MSDEAHMVSTAMLGPPASKKYETWLAMEARLPGTTTGSPSAVRSAPCSWYSEYMAPTNTPTSPASAPTRARAAARSASRV
ncbi:hypothetical protein GCM10020366_38670 [Saccharopolyspora gregorii]|uniref:Uncharacterized protein n=1 Tax=Saccharopolyspora gregorii TaxID=33914 RepID=A0ABP6RU85_9PSEU